MQEDALEDYSDYGDNVTTTVITTTISTTPWSNDTTTEPEPTPEDEDYTWIIVGSVLGGLALIALVIGAIVAVIIIRRKRRWQGRYQPATQERLQPEMTAASMIAKANMLPLPKPERLI